MSDEDRYPARELFKFIRNIFPRNAIIKKKYASSDLGPNCLQRLSTDDLTLYPIVTPFDAFEKSRI